MQYIPIAHPLIRISNTSLYGSLCASRCEIITWNGLVQAELCKNPWFLLQTTSSSWRYSFKPEAKSGCTWDWFGSWILTYLMLLCPSQRVRPCCQEQLKRYFLWHRVLVHSSVFCLKCFARVGLDPLPTEILPNACICHRWSLENRYLQKERSIYLNIFKLYISPPCQMQEGSECRLEKDCCKTVRRIPTWNG